MRKALVTGCLLLCGLALAPAQEPLDMLIRNGSVIDGSGRKAFRADVGIRNGMIVQIGNLGSLQAKEAIRKMTSLPASQFGFEKRGMIQKGYAADLVLFSKETVKDRATYAAPHQYPDGIPVVIVNGAPVVRDGKHTGARPGQPLRSDSRESRPSF